MSLSPPPPSAIAKRLQALAPHVGSTPLMRLERLEPRPGVALYAKAEWQQLGGSIKSRAAFAILSAAAAQLGGRRVLDATSGNTGIAYATFCAAAGIPLTLCMPENASPERKRILEWLGAELVFTSPFEATEGAQDAAREWVRKHPGRCAYLDQYSNEANWKAHVQTTAPEVWDQTQGRITHFIAGLGTTGTFTGTTRGLKSRNADVQCIALQPETALHGLEGWKHLETARVPEIFDAGLADATRTVSTESAYAMIRRAAREEGLLLSPSAAANLAGAVALASELESGVVVTVFADDASKYHDTLSRLA